MALESPHTIGPTEALLVETYGLRLLAFLCGADHDVILARLNGSASLPDAAEAVLTEHLVPLAQSVAAKMAAQPGLPRRFALDVLGQPVDVFGSSLGMILRSLALGGEEPPPTNPGDPVKDALGRLAVCAFPAMLAPTDVVWQTSVPSLYQHPARTELQAALQRDESLSNLFTEDDPGLGRRGYIFSSLGRGTPLQDVGFGGMILASAWHSLAMTRYNVGLEDLLTQVDANVDALRLAVLGKQVLLPSRLVFTGFTTKHSRTIATPWGRLRPLEDWERQLAPPGLLEGAVSRTEPSGNPTTVSYAGEMVLETTVPYSIVMAKEPDMSTDLASRWPALSGVHASRRREEGVQLALLLAIDRPVGSWVTAKLTWQWTADLLEFGGNVSWTDPRQRLHFIPYALSEDECQAVEAWASLIEQHWTDKINISVRRLLSAANARTDMADRLVDAVIVWENLFGTSQGETRLRISAAMTWLLEPTNVDAREALQAQLRKIYDDRSKIVHGGNPDEFVLARQADTALEHARDILRILLRDRSDVLALPDGAARSTRLMLGG